MRVLYLDIDTLRPDHLGCYGYHRNTSPNIDQIAKEGVIFDQYYTPDAPCLPSRSSLMTGTFGIHHGSINHGGHNADFRLQGQKRGFHSHFGENNLPAYLKKELGLNTVYVGGFGERHTTYNYYAGFREIYDTGKGGMESAEEVTPTVMDWLERNGASDNWYLHVNYWDPHTPYRAPAEIGNPFENEPLPEWMTEEEVERQIKETVGPHGIGEVNMFNDNVNPQYPRQVGKVTNFEDARKEFDGYDCGILYADKHVGTLINKIKELGVYDDLVIIVSSDHGENFGELGLWSEHGSADYCTSRIPMIMRVPGALQNHVDTGFHYNIDLLPTLAELYNKEPRSTWEGASYAKSLTAGEDTGRDSLVLSQCCHGCQRSVRWGNYIYIRTYHDFFHLFPKEMLFNVVTDPHEQHNIAEEYPEICAEASRIYLNWYDEMMMTQPEGYMSDPMWETIHQSGPFHSSGHLQQYCERLEQTGRAWAIPALKAAHPEEF